MHFALITVDKPQRVTHLGRFFRQRLPARTAISVNLGSEQALTIAFSEHVEATDKQP